MIGNRFNLNAGFTLAEVLVTLGIIGVVSAMTVPSLMQNYQRQSYITQLHKIYNELQQAFVQEMTEQNALNLYEAGLNSKTSIKNFFNKHLRVIQTCEGIAEPCFKTTYRNLNGASLTFPGTWGAGNCAVIASGAAVCLDYPSSNGSFGYVFIDVNGQKEPNILGRDAFYLAVFKDGVLDTKKATIECRTNGTCSGAASLEDARGTVENCKSATSYIEADSCFGQILNDNWEMTY